MTHQAPSPDRAPRPASRGPLVGFIARVLQRPRLGLALLLLPILTYLTIGAGLVLFVNRGFLFNEVLAFVLYSALIAAVVVLERTDPQRAAPPKEGAPERK